MASQMSIEVITHPETRVARKARRCTWCGQMINKGERYSHQRVKVDDDPSVNDLHPECSDALDEAVSAEGGSVTYDLYEQKRPALQRTGSNS
jgi:hypothetical protein